MSIPKPNTLLRSSAALRGARNVSAAANHHHPQSNRATRRYAHTISSASTSNPAYEDDLSTSNSTSSSSAPLVLGCNPPAGSKAAAIAEAAAASGHPNGGTSTSSSSNYQSPSSFPSYPNNNATALSSSSGSQSSSFSSAITPSTSTSNPPIASSSSSSSSSNLNQRSNPKVLTISYPHHHRSKSHQQRHARALHFWSPTNPSSLSTTSHNNSPSTSTTASAPSYHTHTVSNSTTSFEGFPDANAHGDLIASAMGGTGGSQGGLDAWLNAGAGQGGTVKEIAGLSLYSFAGGVAVDQRSLGNHSSELSTSVLNCGGSEGLNGSGLPTETIGSGSEGSHSAGDLYFDQSKASSATNQDFDASFLPSSIASSTATTTSTAAASSSHPPPPPSPQSTPSNFILAPSTSQPTSNQQQPTNQPYMTRAPSFLPPFHISVSSSSSSSMNKTPGLPPHWARTFSLPPRHPRKPAFCFEHGAYGIPKRHPLAALPSSSKGRAKRTNSNQSTGAAGMLAAAADFLTGPQTPVEAPREGDKPSRGGGGTRGKAGPSESIRENGKIDPDRLASVSVGEDAYFLRPDSIGVADGVGGWASRPGANPALYSRLLMHFCSVELSRFDELSASDLAANNGAALSRWESLDPVEVMHRAWERCVRASRREGILGSSTALLAVLRGDELRIANLGDCVLLIIRAGDLYFRSTEQQHSFNFPVQLGMMGSTAESVKMDAKEMEMKAQNAKEDEDLLDVDDPPVYAPFQNQKLNVNSHLFSSSSNPTNPSASKKPTSAGTDYANSPVGSSLPTSPVDAEWDEPRRDAGRWTVKVQRGDIIILGSDGLVDNLFDEDILEEVCRFAPAPDDHPDSASTVSGSESSENSSTPSSSKETVLPPDFSPQLVSEALCSRAKAVSEDSRAVASPFQQKAMEEGLHYVGGKHDDISVLVAVVGDRDLPSEEVSPPSSNSSTSSSSSSASSDSNSSSHVNASSKNSNLSLGGHSSSTRSFSQL